MRACQRHSKVCPAPRGIAHRGAQCLAKYAKKAGRSRHRTCLGPGPARATGRRRSPGLMQPCWIQLVVATPSIQEVAMRAPRRGRSLWAFAGLACNLIVRIDRLNSIRIARLRHVTGPGAKRSHKGHCRESKLEGPAPLLAIEPAKELWRRKPRWNRIPLNVMADLTNGPATCAMFNLPCWSRLS